MWILFLLANGYLYLLNPAYFWQYKIALEMNFLIWENYIYIKLIKILITNEKGLNFWYILNLKKEVKFPPFLIYETIIFNY